jgi:hypothetical protein
MDESMTRRALAGSDEKRREAPASRHGGGAGQRSGETG